ncbi:helix-turn-helix domain-containing protein [Leptolyngbya sp. FACHB-261]|uniref:helix-turn-helix domain-containing protein n=1 Tax=Leptolyngbya sp. FACHB-261 TaxID=2692806 RepID=UPI0037C199BB
MARWAITQEQLADLLGVSRSAVAHWFSALDSKHKRNPPESVKRQLAEINALWSLYENEPEHLRQAWEARRLRILKASSPPPDGPS